MENKWIGVGGFIRSCSFCNRREERISEIKKTLSWFYQIKFVKMKAKVYFCKVGTGKHDRNEGKPVNEGDAPPPSNQ